MLQFVSHLYLGWSTWHLLMNFYQVAQITIVLISGCSVQGQHWPPGGVENRGQVRGVRPSPPGPGQGHHDLHAPDEVYVQVRLDVHMLMKPNLSTSPFLTIYQTLVSAIWWRVQNLRGRGRGWPEHKTPSVEEGGSWGQLKVSRREEKLPKTSVSKLIAALSSGKHLVGFSKRLGNSCCTHYWKSVVATK